MREFIVMCNCENVCTYQLYLLIMQLKVFNTYGIFWQNFCNSRLTFVVRLNGNARIYKRINTGEYFGTYE